MRKVHPRQMLYDINHRGFIAASFASRLNDAAGEDFESAFAAFTGSQSVVPLPRGRLAVYFAVKHAIAQTGRRRVILSAFTIFDVVNMVRAAGGSPVFIDTERSSPHLTPDGIEAAIDDDTGAVIVTHYHTSNRRIAEIASLCARKNVMLIEDCAIALGSRIDGRHVGTFGDVGMFSFGLFKFVCTYFGGAAILRSQNLADGMRREMQSWPRMGFKDLWPYFTKGVKLSALTTPAVFDQVTFPVFRFGVRHNIAAITNQAKNDPQPVLQEQLPDAYKRRPSSFQLREWSRQLGSVEENRRRRIENARTYRSGLKNLNWLTLPPEPDPAADAFLNFPVLVAGDRDALMRDIMEQGFDCAKYYYRNCAAIAAFDSFGKSLPNLQDYVDRLIFFPTHPTVPHDYIQRLCTYLVGRGP